MFPIGTNFPCCWREKRRHLLGPAKQSGKNFHSGHLMQDQKGELGTAQPREHACAFINGRTGEQWATLGLPRRGVNVWLRIWLHVQITKVRASWNSSAWQFAGENSLGGLQLHRGIFPCGPPVCSQQCMHFSSFMSLLSSFLTAPQWHSKAVSVSCQVTLWWCFCLVPVAVPTSRSVRGSIGWSYSLCLEKFSCSLCLCLFKLLAFSNEGYSQR